MPAFIYIRCVLSESVICSWIDMINIQQLLYIEETQLSNVVSSEKVQRFCTEMRIRMWIADQWKDYEVIDTSNGEKLERWGKYILVRPDPQVIWNTPRKDPRWKKKNGHYHRSAKGGGEWEFFDLPQEWSISYRDLTFHLKPFSFKHTGLFPEQAVNWDWFSSIIKDAGRPLKVLNLFAYTGGATLAAAKAGASVTHVDASKGMVTWAKENAAASGLADAPIRWLVDDCVKFVEREIRRGNTYDGIIMDPPSYGRGPKGEIWKIEESIFPLIQLTAKILSKDARFFLVNSYTTGLQPAVLTYMIHTALHDTFGGQVESSEIGLPVSGNGLVLPCGASGRWTR
jgi:23S rRNA (cytosine1962-C5)-methyltransferase